MTITEQNVNQSSASPSPTEVQVALAVAQGMPRGWIFDGATVEPGGMLCASIRGPVACHCGAADCNGITEAAATLKAEDIPALVAGIQAVILREGFAWSRA